MEPALDRALTSPSPSPTARSPPPCQVSLCLWSPWPGPSHQSPGEVFLEQDKMSQILCELGHLSSRGEAVPGRTNKPLFSVCRTVWNMITFPATRKRGWWVPQGFCGLEEELQPGRTPLNYKTRAAGLIWYTFVLYCLPFKVLYFNQTARKLGMAGWPRIAEIKLRCRFFFREC